MLGCLFLLLTPQTPIAQIDALAHQRDEQGMAKSATPELMKSVRPFKFLRQNGTYDVGSKGWRALELKTPYGKSFVVFSTKLTSEDIGEQVFELRGGKLAKYMPETDKLGVEIAHHDIQVWFDIPKKTAILKDTVTFKKLQGAGKFFLVRMSPHYKVSDVTNASGAAVSAQQAGGVVVLPTGSGSEFKYKLSYSGVVDLPHYAGSISNREANLTNDYWYPMIARWPATYKVRIVHPVGWTAVAQGEIAPAASSGPPAIVYDMKLPVTYFSLTAGPYKTVEKQLGDKTYRVWSSSLSQEDMQIQAEVNRPIIEFFEKSFGRYPFSGWGALIAETYGGGALEAYSYATYGPGWLPAIDAHEPAHTWWGGLINNTYLKSLWNESFASFSDDFYRREGPIGVAHEKRLAYITANMPSPMYSAAPLVNSGADIGGAAGALGYGKGAAVLQMLEQEMGTEKLLQCMREWIRVHPKGVPGEWEHFEAVVLRLAGAEYKRFFDEWMRRPGWASFTIDNVRLSQGSITGSVKWEGTPYHLQCDVLVQYENGKQDFHKVRLTPSGSFEVELRQYRSLMRPVSVSFDPWRRLLRRYDGNEVTPSLEQFVGRSRFFVDPAQPEWLREIWPAPNRAVNQLPEDLSGLLIIGSPETLPAMKPLCDKVGFKVSGNFLTYDGTTIDLRKNAAMAIVELGEGKRCVIGLGNTLLSPNFGRAYLALTDEYGHMLRGKTYPKTSGFLTYRL